MAWPRSRGGTSKNFSLTLVCRLSIHISLDREEEALSFDQPKAVNTMSDQIVVPDTIYAPAKRTRRRISPEEKLAAMRESMEALREQIAEAKLQDRIKSGDVHDPETATETQKMMRKVKSARQLFCDLGLSIEAEVDAKLGDLKEALRVAVEGQSE